MELVQEFESPASPDQVWAALIDIERVTPCLPGAQVTEVRGDGVYGGSFTAKIGPTKTTMNGELRLVEVDESSRTATLHAEGKEKSGQSKAQATIVFTVSPAGQASRVHVDTQYTIGGRLARFGRGGLIEDVAGKILEAFAANLQGLLATESGAPEKESSQPGDEERPDTAPQDVRRAAVPPQAAPSTNLNFGAILLGIIRDRIRRWFTRR